jgi:hypothetical protein
MHAVMVTVTLNDFEIARTFLREEVVPRVSQAPGFVAGYWVRVAEDQGTSVIVFESEEAARSVADQIPTPPAEAATINSTEVGEVVEHA